jgi:hypothetical protein
VQQSPPRLIAPESDILPPGGVSSIDEQNTTEEDASNSEKYRARTLVHFGGFWSHFRRCSHAQGFPGTACRRKSVFNLSSFTSYHVTVTGILGHVTVTRILVNIQPHHSAQVPTPCDLDCGHQVLYEVVAKLQYCFETLSNQDVSLSALQNLKTYFSYFSL